jgi:hypothetical protein
LTFKLRVCLVIFKKKRKKGAGWKSTPVIIQYPMKNRV